MFENLITEFYQFLQQEIIKIIIDLCKGLEYLHKKGLMHRDVKPQNILISEDGNVKLCDLEVVTEIDRSNPTK